MILDLLFILILFVGTVIGFRRGLVSEILNFIGMILGLYIAVKMYPSTIDWITSVFNTTVSIAGITGFIIVLFVFNSIWNTATGIFLSLSPFLLSNNILLKIGGAIVGLLYNILMVSVLASFILLMPASNVSKYIETSQLAPVLSGLIENYLRNLNGLVSDVIRDVEDVHIGQSAIGEVTKLDLPYKELANNPIAEQKLFSLVNEARVNNGLKPLTYDTQLEQVARYHARNMWERQYFAHNDPDGNSPFDRLKKANIIYGAAGENLALAPSVVLAHRGLMESPKHRDNILYASFTKMGIGTVTADSGSGSMFVQLFSN